MSQLTVVLPFALPAPEFAPDLTAALTAPALAALVTRTTSRTRQLADTSARALPHELWLADALGLRHGAQPAVARAAMRGFGLDPRDGAWFLVHPAHIEIGHSHLLMPDLRQLRLNDEDARALFDTAREACEALGLQLAWGDATTWFLRADAWAGLDTASPDYAVGMNLNDCMPDGAHGRAFRKVHNEVQILWHGHPANARREGRGHTPVNAFWLWGGAPAGLKPAANPRLAAYAASGWVDGLANDRLAQLDDLAFGGGDTVLVCGNLAAPALAADWSAWLDQMHMLENALFARLLDALRRGQVQKLRLVLSHRDACADLTTTLLAQRMFWRRPTLDHLK